MTFIALIAGIFCGVIAVIGLCGFLVVRALSERYRMDWEGF